MNTRQRIGLVVFLFALKYFPSEGEFVFAIQFLCILIGGIMFMSPLFNWEEA